MPRKLSNVTTKEYRNFLKSIGCKHTRTTGGHEHWTRNDLLRPITFQTHIDPVPEFIIANALRILGINKKQFLQAIS